MKYNVLKMGIHNNSIEIFYDIIFQNWHYRYVFINL